MSETATTQKPGFSSGYPYNFGNMSRSQILDSFLTVINIVRPDHPYCTKIYPLSSENVEHSYKKRTGSAYASCGPRHSQRKPVSFSSDKYKYNSVDPERILAINTHEVTHVSVGSHSDREHGSHPPRFWREFGFNAHQVLDSWDSVQARYGSVSQEKYIGYIVKKEVNSYNIDRRYGDVNLRRQEMARWFENTLNSI